MPVVTRVNHSVQNGREIDLLSFVDIAKQLPIRSRRRALPPLVLHFSPGIFYRLESIETAFSRQRNDLAITVG